MAFDFDEIIDRRGTHSAKWDAMGQYGVDPANGVSMWVADMDFRAPPAVAKAIADRVEHGVFGYYADDASYRAAVTGWMKRRHGWEIDPAWISTTHGLVAGTSHCVRAWSEPGDGVIIFTPVYHAFHKVIRANGREIVESELVNRNGRYEMDLETLAGALTGREKMVILCSPHNPGGRVWTVEELRALADFCVAHDLILVSDEIHHDLVFPGATHTVMAKAAPHITDRLVTCAAATKTFNIAGAMTGAVIIEDAKLRQRFAEIHLTAGSSANMFGMLAVEAAYTEGDAWLDALVAYIDENRRVFDAGVNAIPGLKSMALEATYLAWVDFADTGMEKAELQRRVWGEAQIAANAGETFGKGGETFLRFNLATRRALVEEAVARLARVFGDLQ